jgi:hypothetical protein
VAAITGFTARKILAVDICKDGSVGGGAIAARKILVVNGCKDGTTWQGMQEICS